MSAAGTADLPGILVDDGRATPRRTESPVSDYAIAQLPLASAVAAERDGRTHRRGLRLGCRAPAGASPRAAGGARSADRVVSAIGDADGDDDHHDEAADPHEEIPHRVPLVLLRKLRRYGRVLGLSRPGLPVSGLLPFWRALRRPVSRLRPRLTLRRVRRLPETLAVSARVALSRSHESPCHSC